MKNDVIWRKHHELEKAFRNHERDNSNYSNDILNKYIKSISDCDIIKELNERKKK